MDDVTPMTKADAQAQHLMFYYSGYPCRSGHFTKRRAINGACVECEQIKSKAYASLPAEQQQKLRDKAVRSYHRNLENNRHKARIRSQDPETKARIKALKAARRLNPEYKKRERALARQKERERQGLPIPTRAAPADNVCECCGLMQYGAALALDHDHPTDKFRGWLCSRCNRAMGLFGDSIEGLMKAVHYLERANAS